MKLHVSDGGNAIEIGPCGTIKDLLESAMGRLTFFLAGSESDIFIFALYDDIQLLLKVEVNRFVPLDDLLSRIGVALPGVTDPGKAAEGVLQVGSRVSYATTYRVRTGTVIEIGKDLEGDKGWGHRARVKWDDNRPRTWIRIHALVVLKG